MREFGDGNRPLRNTEWGIEARNTVTAWGQPGDDREANARWLDEDHRAQWQAVLEDCARRRLYGKISPYQYHALNEVAVDAAGKPPARG